MTVDDAYECLGNAYRSERLAHGYIIEGSPREAARELAERLLSLVFCPESDEEACGTCRACREIRDRTHPDLHWLEPQKRSRILSIDQIRELRGRMFQTAFAGAWKAAVLVGADRLQHQAANAFLKTLEEPPARSLFLLLTNSPQFLLPTIVSRCQTVSLPRGEELLEGEWLAEALDIIGGASSCGRDLAGMVRSERMLRLLGAMKKQAEAEQKDEADAEALDEDDETLDARATARYREFRSLLLRSMILWYRDLLLLHCGADDGALHYREHGERLREQVSGVSYREVLRSVVAVEDMDRRFERSMPEGLVLGAGFARMV